MRYTPPPAELFIRNREKFIARMKPQHAAVIFANEILIANGDANYKFTQNSDFYYLTGIDQEDGILFLFPDAPREDQRQILFTRKTNEHIQVWEGWKYTKEEAQTASGIATIKYLEDFDNVFYHLVSHIEGFYLDFNEHDRNRKYMYTSAHAFAERLGYEFPAHKIERANPILSDLRQIKEPEEIAVLQKAIDIAEKGFRRILQFVKPGIYEYEIEAELIHEYIRNGGTGFAFDPIIASGKNTNTLHYNLNDQIIQDGDLVLIDCGCEYGLFHSDLTRVIPANGKFTPRQKEVYLAVLHVMNEAKKLLVPADYTLDQYHEKIGFIMEEQLLKLGLLTPADIDNQDPEWPAYKKYFMHGTSHHLGLDTHDLGGRYTPLRAGMVFTVEPGIYIPEEGFGIRLENNVLITENGVKDLTENIPLLPDDIESLMQR
jgi:Xaa-Pro aminopeptidase